MITGRPCGVRGTVKGPRVRKHGALVVEPMDLRGVGEHARRAVEDDGVVLPRVPVAEHRLHEIVGLVVAAVVLEVRVVAEVRRLGIVERRHHVPRRAAPDHVVERREDAGDVEGLEVRRGVRAADAEVSRGEAHRGHERDEIHLDHADAVADRLAMVVLVAVGHGQAVVEERQVEAPGLQRARDALVVLSGEEVRRRRGVPPGRGVVRAASFPSDDL
jgi:hypothetical protein